MKFDVVEIAAIDAVEIAVEPWIWPFAQTRRADIDRHFAAQQRERSALWNGRVLLLHRLIMQASWRGAIGVVPQSASSISLPLLHCNRPTAPFYLARWRRSPRLRDNGFFRAARWILTT